jgi:hypothetical protein
MCLAAQENSSILDYQIIRVEDQCYKIHNRIEEIALGLIALVSFVAGYAIKHASRSLQGFTLLNVAAKSTQLGLACLFVYAVYQFFVPGRPLFSTKYDDAGFELFERREEYKTYLSGQEPTVENAIAFSKSFQASKKDAE